MSVVAAEHLSKWYGQVIGLNDVTLRIPPGVTGLLGPNGAGKSTFMKLITGQLAPSKGTVQVLGGPVWGNPTLYFRLGFCPEQDAFYERMSGLEWVTSDLLRNYVAYDALRKIELGSTHSPLVASLVEQGWLFKPFAGFSLALELGAPLALLSPRIARPWLLCALGFHVGVLLVMAIFFPYPLFGVAFASFFPVEKLVERFRRGLQRFSFW